MQGLLNNRDDWYSNYQIREKWTVNNYDRVKYPISICAFLSQLWANRLLFSVIFSRCIKRIAQFSRCFSLHRHMRSYVGDDNRDDFRSCCVKCVHTLRIPVDVALRMLREIATSRCSTIALARERWIRRDLREIIFGDFAACAWNNTFNCDTLSF